MNGTHERTQSLQFIVRYILRGACIIPLGIYVSLWREGGMGKSGGDSVY
jgi:hypothetical protein